MSEWWERALSLPDGLQVIDCGSSGRGHAFTAEQAKRYQSMEWRQCSSCLDYVGRTGPGGVIENPLEADGRCWLCTQNDENDDD